MALYRLKSLTFDCIRWESNRTEVEAFFGADALAVGAVQADGGLPIEMTEGGPLVIMSGDWLLRLGKDELYRCEAESFEFLFEKV